jgi:hypothetical protein
VHHGPGVDVPRLAGDVIALRGGEEQRQAGDVVGARDVLHDRDGTLADERDWNGMRAYTRERDAAGGVGGPAEIVSVFHRR